MEDTTLLAEFTDILLDESILNPAAAQRLEKLANEFRGMGGEAKLGVWDQPVEDIQHFVNAVFARLNLLDSSQHGKDVSIQGRVLTAILKFLPSPLPDDLSDALFDHNFSGILAAVMDTMFALSDIERDQDSQTLLVLLLQTLSDLADADLKIPEGTQAKNVPKAAEIVGRHVMDPLLKNLPETRRMRVNVRRCATSLLLTLLTSNVPNQKLLLTKDVVKLLPEVFSDFLVRCGDFATQVDLMETLYRCCKGQLKQLSGDFFSTEPVQQGFLKMLAKSSKTVNLSKELRQLLGMINEATDPRVRRVKDAPVFDGDAIQHSVHSFQANGIHFSCPNVVKPVDAWVDVGDQQVTFSAKIMDQESLGTQAWDQVMEEPLDFEFSDIKCASVEDDPEDPSLCYIEITMKKNPESIQEDYPFLANEPVSVKVRARKDVAAPLIASLSGVVVAVASQDPVFDGFVHSQELERIRKKKKMSLGLPAGFQPGQNPFHQAQSPDSSALPNGGSAAASPPNAGAAHSAPDVAAAASPSAANGITEHTANGVADHTPAATVAGAPPPLVGRGLAAAAQPPARLAPANAAEAVRAMALDAANAAIALQPDAAIVHAEAVVVTATEVVQPGGVAATAATTTTAAVTARTRGARAAATAPTQPLPPIETLSEAQPDEAAPRFAAAAAEPPVVEDGPTDPRRPPKKATAKAAAAPKPKTRSTGGRSIAGGSAEDKKAVAATPAAGTGGKRKTASRKAPLSPLDLVARDDVEDAAAQGGGAAVAAGAANGEDAVARLESSPDWLRAAVAAPAPAAGTSRAQPALSEEDSLGAGGGAPPPSPTKAFSTRSRGTAEVADKGDTAMEVTRDPYELRDSQEGAAAGGTGSAGSRGGTLGGNRPLSLGNKSPRKPVGRLAALGITSPRKGKLPTSRLTQSALRPAAPATAPAEKPAGSRDSETTKEPATRGTGSADAGGSKDAGAGWAVRGRPPTGRAGGPKAPLPPVPKGKGGRTAKTLASLPDSIENDASLPAPPDAKKRTKKLPGQGPATLDSLDTIEDPDSSLPDRAGQRSQNAPGKSKAGKRPAGSEAAPAGDSKRPRRESAAKAAQAIKQQAQVESPRRASGHARPSARAAATAPTASPAPAAAAAAGTAPAAVMAPTGPSLYDLFDNIDEHFDDFAAPRKKTTPAPRGQTAAAASKPAKRAVTAPSPSPAPAAAEGRKTTPRVQGTKATAASLKRTYAEIDKEELMADFGAESEEEPEAAAGHEEVAAAPAARGPAQGTRLREGSGHTERHEAPPTAVRPATSKQLAVSGRPTASGKPAPSHTCPAVSGRPQQSHSRPGVLQLVGQSPGVRSKPQALVVEKSPRPAGAPLLPTKKQLAAQQKRKRTTVSGAPVSAAPAATAPGSVSRPAKPSAATRRVGKLDLQSKPAAGAEASEETEVPDFYDAGGYEEETVPETQAEGVHMEPEPAGLGDLQLPTLQPYPPVLTDERLRELQAAAAAFTLPAAAGAATAPRAAAAPAFRLPELRLEMPTAEPESGAALGLEEELQLPPPTLGAGLIPPLKLPSLDAGAPLAKKRKTTTGGMGGARARGAGAGLGALGGLGSLGLGGGSLPQEDSQAQKLAMLLRAGLGGDSEDQEEDDGLLAIILQTFAKKKQEARQRKEAVLEEARNKIQQAASDLEVRLSKESRAQAGLVARTLTTLNQELQNKFDTIATLQEQFNTRITTAWQEYCGVVESLETAKQEMARMATARSAAAKRQLSDLQSQSEAVLRDAVQRAEKEERAAKKLQGLPQLLQGLMGA